MTLFSASWRHDSKYPKLFSNIVCSKNNHKLLRCIVRKQISKEIQIPRKIGKWTLVSGLVGSVGLDGWPLFWQKTAASREWDINHCYNFHLSSKKINCNSDFKSSKPLSDIIWSENNTKISSREWDINHWSNFHLSSKKINCGSKWIYVISVSTLIFW